MTNLVGSGTRPLGVAAASFVAAQSEWTALYMNSRRAPVPTALRPFGDHMNFWSRPGPVAYSPVSSACLRPSWVTLGPIFFRTSKNTLVDHHWPCIPWLWRPSWSGSYLRDQETSSGPHSL